ncbi:FAD-dependent oxidoreductase [Burkholderia stabilis]|uniref:NAD(P)/FAD-dependent oxidoreductase n=1 Tax=Burkholderia stabilis TaxID=95485 RepID=UPI000851C0FC|nr:FAD-dependent oxidoreductase [Burkholderia stabilis]AOR72692.1 FAD-dependent oxidoreductase [Burkholderia stabilis]HDR9494412.1 FAD-binding oxidoreductase [Burkholderia stabilis]HDR9525376.1 FAD-binding oxidoreductase [Burkholderia stabilis]HDR9528409.1 FAD-binding oxidoreductase [Burkholderia stabilis]HDR9541818.1 FAD-binding oxidoreductase [Burkholderia stabilis]
MMAPGKQAADVAIVGGGYTGLSAAIHLAEQGATVEVCDADPPGDVPSAFNFGSVASVAPALPRGPRSAEHAQAAEREAARAIAYLQRFVDSRNLACGWAHPGHITLACDDASAAQLARRFEYYAAQPDARVAWLDAQAVARETGAARAVAGLLNLRFALIQPRALRDAMRMRAATLGVRIRRGARVNALRLTPDAVALDLDGATLIAGSALVCAEDAWPLLPDGIRPPLERYGTHLLATGVLDEATQRCISMQPRVYGTVSADKDYFRLDEGRLLFGSRLGLAADAPPAGAEAALRARLAAYFPALERVSVERVWSAPLGFTAHGVPHVGMAGRLGWCGGYCGSGIAAAVHGGAALAGRVLDRAGRAAFHDSITGAGEAR